MYDLSLGGGPRPGGRQTHRPPPESGTRSQSQSQSQHYTYTYHPRDETGPAYERMKSEGWHASPNGNAVQLGNIEYE
jgi:hypothetical protein